MGNVLLAADLHRVLSDVKNFASKDRTLPSICVIHIEGRDNNLIASATDRFTLGVSRADYSGDELNVSISLANADNLIRMAKTNSKDAPIRTVEIRTTEYIRDGQPLMMQFIFATGEELHVSAESADFPKFRQLLPAENIPADAQADAMTGYDANLLAKFAKVSESTTMKVFHRGRTKPTLITVGSDFVGLIMPSRRDDNGYTKPNWL